MYKDQFIHELGQLGDNLCLYYSRLVDDIYQQLMEKALAAGHEGLKLSHALILPQISANGSRIIDIARKQNVSKQAIGQIANELEELGYIARLPDPDDKRAKKLVLTEKGIRLITESAGFIRDVETRIETSVGLSTFRRVKELSRQLFKALQLEFPDAGQFTPELGTQLPLIVYATSIATHLDTLLQQENTRLGHTLIKRSYWHILEQLAQNGVRINALAESNGISKQAISQLANEIEQFGYLRREEDPDDKRARKLFLTKKGEQLVSDTLASTRQVEAWLAVKIGQGTVVELKQCLHECLGGLKKIPGFSPMAAPEEQLRKGLLAYISQLGEAERQRWLGAENRLSEHAISQLNRILAG